MFTGLVEEIGEITALRHQGRMLELTVAASVVTADLAIGDSVNIAGACQTVTSHDTSRFTVQAVEETLRRTTFQSLRSGSKVNLERALRLGDRLGGHLVQGHVEGIGTVAHVRREGEHTVLSISPPSGLERYIVEKGSITIDGVSLTVTESGGGRFGVAVIPHTLSATTLGMLKNGDRVNLETDIIARYVERLLDKGGSLTMERLESLGF